MSQEDVLDRLRSLDPNVRFHDDDELYEAQAVMHRVLARPNTRRRRLRLPVGTTFETAGVEVVVV